MCIANVCMCIFHYEKKVSLMEPRTMYRKKPIMSSPCNFSRRVQRQSVGSEQNCSSIFSQTVLRYNAGQSFYKSFSMDRIDQCSSMHLIKYNTNSWIVVGVTLCTFCSTTESPSFTLQRSIFSSEHLWVVALIAKCSLLMQVSGTELCFADRSELCPCCMWYRERLCNHWIIVLFFPTNQAYFVWIFQSACTSSSALFWWRSLETSVVYSRWGGLGALGRPKWTMHVNSLCPLKEREQSISSWERQCYQTIVLCHYWKRNAIHSISWQRR